MFKKLFLAGLGLIVIVAIALFFFGASLLNSSIKKGVETFGPKVTQTPVLLDEVDISIFGTRAILKGLYVGNPKGYKSEYIFSLGEVDVDVRIKSVLSDQIIIDHVVIRQPEISYETNITRSNVKDLLKNVESFTGSSDASAPADETPEADSASTKSIVIKKVQVLDGSVYVGLLGAGQKVKLPNIELTDLGENKNLTIAQCVDIVLTEVIKAIGPAIADAGGILEDSGKSILKSGDESVKKATEGIKSLFGK